MKTSFVNSKEAFEQAIENGILSAREEEQDFAGNFMYMYSLEGVHYFKNRITRKYGYDRETIIQSIAMRVENDSEKPNKIPRGTMEI